MILWVSRTLFLDLAELTYILTVTGNWLRALLILAGLSHVSGGKLAVSWSRMFSVRKTGMS